MSEYSREEFERDCMGERGNVTTEDAEKVIADVTVTDRMRSLAEMIEESLLEGWPDAATLEKVGMLRGLLDGEFDDGE